ncbi:hypothetical protein [Actinomadura opuntiae]|uniref:hypothetical protein n=1 Tax=Actinomadura sp. OS1-43 TaxID=604315 RepID=UPI00255B091A|nr:hypothetical protein [Actinomadura sp. OS1-43]MDL4813332.1 hypothetical protein [Actinomadura sp. OS1-43]
MGNMSVGGILRGRVGAGIVLVVGVALVALGLFLSIRIAPGGVRDLHAYQAAPRCAAAPSGAADCRWTQRFTVADIRLTSSRGDVDHAFLTDERGRRWRTEYADRKPVLTDLKEGDQVTGTVWRGRLTEISANGASQKTQDAPADLRARVLILALIVVPSGLLVAVAGGWRLARRAPTPGMAATLGVALGLFLAGLFSPMIGGEDFWTVAAVWLPVAALMAAAGRYHVVRKRAPEPAPS